MGGGHATRGAELCAALEAQGVGARIYADDPAFAKRVIGDRAEVAPCRGRPFSECCRRDALSIAIVDRPHRHPASTEELRALRGAAAVLVAFDENDRGGHFASLHVSVLGPPRRPQVGACRRLWGPRFAIVAPASPRIPSLGTRPKIVVVFGAADPARQSEIALGALAPFASTFAFSLVLGPLIEPARRRVLLRDAQALGIATFDAPGRLGPILADADALVTAFGQTCLEGLAVGLPLLLWHPSDEHAKASSAFFADIPEVCAIDFGAGSLGAASLSLWLGAAAGEHDAFSFFEPSREIDGRGAQRIARHIVAHGSRQSPEPPTRTKGERVA